MSEIDGVWELEMDSIRGNGTAQLSLKTDGATAAGSLSGEKRTFEFDNGRVKDNAVRWEANVKVPLLRPARVRTPKAVANH